MASKPEAILYVCCKSSFVQMFKCSYVQMYISEKRESLTTVPSFYSSGGKTISKPFSIYCNYIHVIRGHRVMLDRDIATFYGVETKRLNEKVKRNPKRFAGEDFICDQGDRSLIFYFERGRDSGVKATSVFSSG